MRPLLFRRWEVSTADCLLNVLNALLDGDLELRKTNGTKKIRIAFDAVREEEQKRYGMTLNRYAELTALLKMLDAEFIKTDFNETWWLELKERFADTDRNNLKEVMMIWWKLRDNGISCLDDKWSMESAIRDKEINSLYELFKEKVCE